MARARSATGFCIGSTSVLCVIVHVERRVCQNEIRSGFSHESISVGANVNRKCWLNAPLRELFFTALGHRRSSRNCGPSVLLSALYARSSWIIPKLRHARFPAVVTSAFAGDGAFDSHKGLRTSICPSCTRTSRQGCGCTAGSSSTRPSSSANLDLCHGHSILPSTNPKDQRLRLIGADKPSVQLGNGELTSRSKCLPDDRTSHNSRGSVNFYSGSSCRFRNPQHRDCDCLSPPRRPGR